MRYYSFTDRLLTRLNDSLALLSNPPKAARANPAESVQADASLDDTEKRHSGALLRIDHTGEVCAQALYDSQLRFAKDDKTRKMLRQAKHEEYDHLDWCAVRLKELGAHTSYLNLYWYWHSFLIGTFAGIVGDKWSLGFVEATEAQVAQHLSDHLERISPKDVKSRAILTQMKVDEIAHGAHAMTAGGQLLPTPILLLMKLNAKVMTTFCYWV